VHTDHLKLLGVLAELIASVPTTPNERSPTTSPGCAQATSASPVPGAIRLCPAAEPDRVGDRNGRSG
jgi:hypothetical protein